MIIDTILDRKAGVPYTQSNVNYIKSSARFFDFAYIVEAFTSRENETIQEALCRYIDEQDYNPTIKDYVREVDWTPNGYDPDF